MARGITISTAHVEYESDKRHYAHVDCPATPTTSGGAGTPSTSSCEGAVRASQAELSRRDLSTRAEDRHVAGD